MTESSFTEILNGKTGNLKSLANGLKKKYQNAYPFPNIVIDDFFNETLLDSVLLEFPDLSKNKGARVFNNHNEKKLAGNGEALFGDVTKRLCHFLNSQPFLEFLQELTGIREQLLPDSYFVGGGHHELKPGGYLKIHADFNKHSDSKLDRRINVLVYLNKDWQDSFGGHFELWNKEMTKAEKKILPIYNRMAIFNTTSTSYHGNPEMVNCPADNSRKSLALYYYTNGRPESEISVLEHDTLFVNRIGVENDVKILGISNFGRFIRFLKILTPPFITIVVKKLMAR